MICDALPFYPPVPTAAPTNLRILPTSANEVYLQWDGIPDEKFNGRTLGYRINYKPYLNGQYKTTTVPKTFTDTAISGLKAFTLYDIEVEAYSGAGPGLPLSGVTKTPEGGKCSLFFISSLQVFGNG